MSSALPASCEYVPEVSTSMYTACAWLPLPQPAPVPASSSAGNVARNFRLFMDGPLGVSALDIVDAAPHARAAARRRGLHQPLDQQRHHDGYVVHADQHAAQLARHVA